MKSFLLTNAAKADLKAIAIYTQKEWGKNQRNIYLRQIDDTFHILSDKPSTGKLCEEIKPGYRKYPIGSHIIFYRSGNRDCIEIVRILHKRMDADQHLQDP
jgi:toxin ParE1/3/4